MCFSIVPNKSEQTLRANYMWNYELCMFVLFGMNPVSHCLNWTAMGELDRRNGYFFLLLPFGKPFAITVLAGITVSVSLTTLFFSKNFYFYKIKWTRRLRATALAGIQQIYGLAARTLHSRSLYFFFFWNMWQKLCHANILEEGIIQTLHYTS